MADTEYSILLIGISSYVRQIAKRTLTDSNLNFQVPLLGLQKKIANSVIQNWRRRYPSGIHERLPVSCGKMSVRCGGVSILRLAQQQRCNFLMASSKSTFKWCPKAKFTFSNKNLNGSSFSKNLNGLGQIFRTAMRVWDHFEPFMFARLRYHLLVGRRPSSPSSMDSERKMKI